MLERMLAAVAGPGPLPAMVADHLGSGGKRVRAGLIAQAGEGLGLDPGRLQPWAAACELLHNATLVHDDVQDGDAMRRGQPALWVRHGMAQAINAGDAMLLAPVRALDVPGYAPIERWELTRALVERSILTACGQSQEQMLIQQVAPSWPDYQAAARAKTGPFFALAVEGVLILAGWSGAAARRASDGLLELGLLFQLADDLEDLWGEKGREAPGADLREGKVSALVAATVEQDPERGAELLAWLRLPRTQRTPGQVQAWTDFFVQSGVRARVTARWRDGLAELPERCAALPPELQQLALATADGLAQKLARLRDR
ncbi:MAG: polyprenyl synthetase family protein [Deltaproteobacteria bacterium]|nr:polyprenyl synthetase family protein [Deltaproteobacteria bacterium]